MFRSFDEGHYDNLGNRTSVAFGNYGDRITVTAITVTVHSIRSFSDGDTYAWTGHGNGTTAYVSNGLNQQTSIGGAAATWDTKGNLTTEPQSGKTYGYSSENLLTSASGGVTLGYDPALRLYQTVSGATTTRFMYDGVDAIAEYNGSNTLQRRFVFDPTTGQPVLWYEGTGTAATNRRYLSLDERGSVIAVSGSTGASLGLNTYDEYGKPGLANLGRYQYTGQKWIAEAGLYDYKYRDYLPHLGIFAQTDPIGQAGGPNLYAYVLADPVNLVDPLGLGKCPFVNGEIVCTGTAPGIPGAIGPGPSGAVNWVEPPSPREPKGRDDDDTLPCSAANKAGKGVLIQLAFTNANASSAALPGVSHTFVVAIDPRTGASFASRAGPGSGPGGGGPGTYGLVSAVSAPYQAGQFPDYGSVNAVQTVGYVNASYSGVTSYMNSFAATTNANNIPYLGPVQNSNSYSAALLAGLGFKPPAPVQRAPGYGSNAPDPNMQCTK